MKKNLFLRLCLMTIALLSFQSCRQDILQEQETYNNSSAFQLTSKRISLSQSKHKAKLTAELSKAKDEFKAFAKKHVQGKTVNFGDSISVNTDEVIYMENGPNYHTYTFNIQRNSPLPNNPIENLVLTPLPDGSYKAYLVTYNLTDAEKAQIVNGGDVSVNNKGTVTPVEGNFSSVLARTDGCTMQINDYYTVCDGNLKHSNGETAAQGCTATNKSQHVVTMTMVCQGGLSPQPGIEGPVDGGPDSGGGSSSATPCSANGVYLQPQDPASSGCSNAGVVTQPNLEAPNFNTPCARANAITSETTFKNNITSLRGKTSEGGERGYRMDYKNATPALPTGTGINNQYLQNKPGTTQIEYKYFVPSTYAILHTHYDSLNDPMFSPEDIIRFNDWLVAAKAWNDNPANLIKVNLKNISSTLVTSQGTYMLTFDGNNVAPLSGYDLTILNDKYIEKVLDPTRTVGNVSGEINYNMNKMEEEFLKFAKQYLPIPGMKLFRVGDGMINTENTEIYLDNSNSRATNNCN